MSVRTTQIERMKNNVGHRSGMVQTTVPAQRKEADLNNGDATNACPCCQSYFLPRLTRMLQQGGPGPMDDVEWFILRSHAEVCTFCRHGVLYLESLLADKKQESLVRVSAVKESGAAAGETR